MTFPKKYPLRISPHFRLAFFIVAGLLAATTIGCSIPKAVQGAATNHLPAAFDNNDINGSDSSSPIPSIPWKQFFTDDKLVQLIDTALKNNQELLITLQEIQVARNEVRLRQGQIFPAVGVRGGVGEEKVGRYTSQGAGDHSTQITPGKEVPDLLPDYRAGLYATWEADIWRKLRNAKAAAIDRYLATIEGKNFILTNLISELATAYYELLALDNKLEIVQQNIELQKNALAVVKVQKEAARVTELAVQKFTAEVNRSQTLQYDLQQQITETENRINLLLGRYPQPVVRSKTNILKLMPAAVPVGLPSPLLVNRADVRQREAELAAANLDVKVARAEFLPSFGITTGLGLQAFKPSYLLKMPESMLLSVAGDLAAPLINRSAIQAEFRTATARQLQALYEYERTVLNAFLEVNNSLANVANLKKSYEYKKGQVAALTQSISISNDLFAAARADYLEVLTSQRDVLEAELELVENRAQQMTAVVQLYRNLGGGWQ